MKRSWHCNFYQLSPLAEDTMIPDSYRRPLGCEAMSQPYPNLSRERKTWYSQTMQTMAFDIPYFMAVPDNYGIEQSDAHASRFKRDQNLAPTTA